MSWEIGCARAGCPGVYTEGFFIVQLMGRSPQIGTERVSVTSAKTYFFPQRLSKNGIIFINNLWMEEKQSGQAPTPLGLVCKL